MLEKLIIFLIFIIINFFILINFNKFTKIINIYDYPDNFRKLHAKKIPLAGGTIFFVNTIILIILSLTSYANHFFDNEFFLSSRNYLSFFLLPSLFYFTGLYDDKYILNSKTKLILTSVFIIFILLIDTDLKIIEISLDLTHKIIPLNDFSLMFTVFCILLFINAFNMLDGVNLNAATYGTILCIIFLFNGILNFIVIVYILSLLCFLFLNYKNKTFLGDNGSLFIASLLALIFIKSYNLNILSTEKIFILMIIPGLDLLRLSLERLITGRHPFSPDRNHLHHYINEKISFHNAAIILQIIFFSPYLFSYLFNDYNVIAVTICIYFFFSLYILKKKI